MIIDAPDPTDIPEGSDTLAKNVWKGWAEINGGDGKP